MQLKFTTCYSHLLYILCSGPILEDAIRSVKYSAPNFAHEGLAGYIEVNVEVEIKDLSKFNNIYMAWYSLNDTRRLNLYGLAKGLGDCR